jgi:Putative prokaryotic signal transducing protein
MYCKKCKAQFIEGIEICPVCGKRLVKNQEFIEEEVPEYQELVTVATTINYFVVPLAKSILQSEDITYFVKGDHLMGMPRFMVPMEIQVAKEDEELARELLKDLGL